MSNLHLEELSPDNAKVLHHLIHFGFHEADWSEILDFWSSPSFVEWFAGHGYTLYTGKDEEPYWSCSTPSLAITESVRGPYPYAHYDANPPNLRSDASLMATIVASHEKVVFAQDTEGRHVAIKVMQTVSEEYRILRFLHKQGLDVLRENCILPVLDFLYFGREACFVVQPRWGTDVRAPYDHTMHEILFMMQSMLKALAFLHSHNIIHRDMKPENYLVNHFGTEFAISYTQLPLEAEREYAMSCRRQLRSERCLEYALMDYNLSMMLPADTDKAQYRLPYTESIAGTWFPADTMQGEFDYDPFVYDVAALGCFFCAAFQHHTKDVHLLAPFLDGMITRDIKKRFTAAEALRFLENMIPMIPEEQLNIPYRRVIGIRSLDYECFNRWDGLPDDFQKQWAMYRAPVGVPLTWKVLRRLREYEFEFRGYIYAPFFRNIPKVLQHQHLLSFIYGLASYFCAVVTFKMFMIAFPVD